MFKQHSSLAGTRRKYSIEYAVFGGSSCSNYFSIEVRSRKSSSSSQKSAKSKRARKEELTRDFENCLEQVLTWLLEAEEELTLLSDVEHEDLSIVKSQFKDFEQFMISLTDSQDTVGRVLHRGQLLCNKAGSEDERDAIQGQLLVVNSRWEELRALAMDRQTALQTQLNKLQQKQLASIDKWLSTVESEMSSAEPVAASSNDVIRQIEQHVQLQSRISNYQDIINNLSTFVAVVDEGDTSDESVGALENSLQSIGTRWQNICRWAESRASQLDGLAELCSQTNEVFDRLSNWLKEREHDLLGLKSAHHLEDSEEVAEQVRKLQKAETALEAEHSSFVRLSQLSCELVARLEPGNGMAANDVRRKLDTITQRWDNLVARIEEHSRTFLKLVRSGKADLKQLKPHEKSTNESLTINDSVKTDRIVKPDQTISSIQVTTLDAINSEATSQNTTDTDADNENHQLVDRFLRHVSKLTSEMEHLQEWTDSFSVSKRPDQVRRMISVCQEKLIEIKDQEAKVNRLQLELEHMHLSADLSSKQLKKANDAFELFAKGWARIVTKISEAMNVLTGHAEIGEEAVVSRAIEEWIGGCDRVLSDLSRVAAVERSKRLYKLSQQLHVQTSNLNFIEKDIVKKAILKKGLEIIQKRIDSLQAESSSAVTSVDGDDVNRELDGEWSTVGDIDALDRDLARSQRAVERTRNGGMSSELVEKAETRKAEMEERRRVTVTALEKMKAAEDILNRLTEKVDCASRSEDELQTVLNELQSVREQLANSETTRKEAERVAEKMLALDDNVPPKIVTCTRDRIRNIVERWRKLENDIEDHINCVRKEHRRCIRIILYQEHLENLLDKVNSNDELEDALSSMDESFVRESYARLSDTREKIANRARDRIAALSKAVEECERFEKNMADLQNWAGQMNSLLAMRRATDICALDVPEEYKVCFFFLFFSCEDGFLLLLLLIFEYLKFNFVRCFVFLL
uniref:Dystrophin n=1 Tax=Heterorhabditis bacteriophora TaxID=37862 RepID=A0A1I7XHC6_HETBA